ncbi:MAG: methyltransferase domain-containing protein [Chloroflexi bacterium]|nr:methyltransferase domain-containing protein [Chloroflexota bacterium]MBP8055393.1 methyltransferase domain-containing protein [Chloroflexota bacterium]
MNQRLPENQINQALRHVNAHWPAYLLGYGGGAIAVLSLALVSVRQGWWGFIPLMLASLLILIYFFGASLWMAYKRDEQAEANLFLAWAQLSPLDTFAHIDLGQRQLALHLVRYLTTGKLTVIDVFNPQLTPGRALSRTREQARPWPQAEPRLICLEGSVDLLPLPDRSVPVVTMAYTLPEFWQRGDQEQLLREIYRILKPGGRLIVLEQMRHPQNVWFLGPLVWRWPAAAYWHELLTTTGFTIRKEQPIHARLAQLFRADKPVQYQSRQLDLGF